MNFLFKESECNFCNSSTKKLLVGNLSPVNLIFSVQGAGLRFGRCLNCNSTGRERLLLSYLHRIDFTIDQLCIVHFAPELKIEDFLKKCEGIIFFHILNLINLCLGTTIPMMLLTWI